MQRWQNDRLVEMFRRECRKVSAGLADAADLPDRLWYHLADRTRVRPEVVPRLWAHVPAAARAGFAAAVRQAAAPEFRLPLWIRGRPMTLEELEVDAGGAVGRAGVGRRVRQFLAAAG